MAHCWRFVLARPLGSVLGSQRKLGLFRWQPPLSFKVDRPPMEIHRDLWRLKLFTKNKQSALKKMTWNKNIGDGKTAIDPASKWRNLTSISAANSMIRWEASAHFECIHRPNLEGQDSPIWNYKVAVPKCPIRKFCPKPNSFRLWQSNAAPQSWSGFWKLNLSVLLSLSIWLRITYLNRFEDLNLSSLVTDFNLT